MRPPRPITCPRSSSATWSMITVAPRSSARSTRTWSGWSTSARARDSIIASNAGSAPGPSGRSGGTGRHDAHQLADGRRRLGAVGDPAVGLLQVDLDDRWVGLRVVAADGLDVAPIARRPRVGHHHPVDGVLLAANAGETDLDHNAPRCACFAGPRPGRLAPC